MNRGDGSGRADEKIECKMASGGEFTVIIEMKTGSLPDEKQLARYVENAGKNSGGVCGLLLCIAGGDDTKMQRYPTMNCRQYESCIRAALKSRPTDDEHMRWLVEDYCETLAFLDDLDYAIRKSGDELWSGLKATAETGCPAKLWYEDHGRWMQQVLVRAVQSRIGDIAKWNSSCGLGSDANGWYLDCWAVPAESLRVGSDEAGAQFFAKWRQGSGVEIHVIVNDYSKRTDEAKKVMEDLWSRACKVVPHLWHHAELGRKRGGASRMVARRPSTSCDLQAIVDLVQADLPRIYDTLEPVARDLRASLGLEEASPDAE